MIPCAARARPAFRSVSGAPASSSACRRPLMSALRWTSSNGSSAATHGWASVALDKGRGPRPASGIGFEPGIDAVAEEAGDRDVGDADVAEQEAVGGQLALEIVERAGMSSLERLVDPRLVARLAPDQRMDELLIEQAPDEEVAEPGVGIFLEPAGAGAVLGVARATADGPDRPRRDRRRSPIESLSEKSPSISTGMRRSGLSRSNSSLPKKGVIGSTSIGQALEVQARRAPCGRRG